MSNLGIGAIFASALSAIPIFMGDRNMKPDDFKPYVLGAFFDVAVLMIGFRTALLAKALRKIE